MQWIEIGSLDSLPKLGARLVRINQKDIAVFRTADDEVFALDNRCPHKGGPLAQGIVHGRHVTCPLHSMVIELDTGNVVAPDKGCTRHYAARVENGTVFIEYRAQAQADAG